MNQMPILEQVLIVVVTVLVVLWVRPGLKAALKQSRQTQHKDWQSLLLPLGSGNTLRPAADRTGLAVAARNQKRSGSQSKLLSGPQ
jgi:hypothetical protein